MSRPCWAGVRLRRQIEASHEHCSLYMIAWPFKVAISLASTAYSGGTSGGCQVELIYSFGLSRAESWEDSLLLMVVEIVLCWQCAISEAKKCTKEQKNNTRDSNVVPHRSTNRAR